MADRAQTILAVAPGSKASSAADILAMEYDFISWAFVATTSAFTILALLRITHLLRLNHVSVVSGRAFATLLAAKFFAGTSTIGLRLALLVVVAKSYDGGVQILAFLVLDLVAASLLLFLSLLEQIKHFRPPVLSCSFLFLTFIYDCTRYPSIWKAIGSSQDDMSRGFSSLIFAKIFTAAIVFELVFLGLECTRRVRWIRWCDSPNGDHETWRNHSPEETSSVIGLGLYWWLNPLLWRGYREPLTMEHLCPLDRSLSAYNFDKWIRSGSSDPCSVSESLTSEVSLCQIAAWLWKPLGLSLMLPVFPRLCLMAFAFSQTFFLQGLLRFLSQDPGLKSDPTDNSVKFVSIAMLIYFGIAVSTGLYWYYQERFQTLLRGFLISAIYEKTVMLNIGRTNADDPVTLVGADVERIYTGVRLVHEVWANIIQVVLAAWLLQRLLGLAFLAPLVVVFICFGSSFVLSKHAPRYQAAWMTRVQRRTGMTASVLARLKDLRISGMTKPAAALLKQEREDEIKVGEQSRLLIATSASLSQVPMALAPALAFAFGPHVLDDTRAFTALAYLILLTAPLLVVLQSLPILAATVACLRRIKIFLMQHARRGMEDMHPALETLTDQEASIVVKDGSFGWTQESTTLHNINLHLEACSITFIVGPVASGKSTLCMALLGEVPRVKGSLILNSSRLAFSGQVPFLYNASIKENIVGFSHFDMARYGDVINATMLAEDLDCLPAGDRTIVGTQGLSLSGGQRQRVSLARALYQRADILILDDVFSGLDGRTQHQVCQALFGASGLLRKRGTAAVVCTHSASFIRFADRVVVLSSDGRIAEQGSPAHVVRVKSRVGQFGLDAISGLNVKQAVGCGSNNRITVPVKTATTTSQPAKDLTPADGQPFVILSPKVDQDVYRHWLRTIGVIPMMAYFTLVLGAGFCTNFPTVWLDIWSRDSTLPMSEHKHTFAFYVGIYALLGACLLVCVFPAGVLMLRTATRLAGTNLHHTAVDTITHSSLRFLSDTDVGRVLNLFSQDMNIIDTQLPRMVNNMCFCLATAMGQAGVIAWSSPWLVLCYPFFAVLLWTVQRVYMPSSKRLRILDLEAKTLLYTNFLDTLAGLPTIRAFGWVPQQLARNQALLDDLQRPLYLLAMAQQWLTLLMNVIVAIVAVILVSLATQLGSKAGNVGAGLVSIITLSNTLTTIIVAYTGLETTLGAIARLKSFGEETEQEDQNPEKGKDFQLLDETWPMTGRVQMQNVKASYNADSEDMVLKGITLMVEPGEKLAVCGRTGNGKSTVLAVLLRLIEPVAISDSTAYSVVIDDVPLNTVDRSIVRERIIVISQDSVFLPHGTSFRANLDPWGTATDAECIAAVRDVHPGLLAVVNTKESGLDATVHGGQLSAGQQQLFCLARAVLRRRVKLRQTNIDGGLLLLDEITSNADAETQVLVGNLLKNEFGAYTVVVVTHRRKMALACDRVIVIDVGKVIEDGRPAALLQLQGSYFRGVVGV